MTEEMETMALRLCDDEGIVQGPHIRTLNQLRWLGNHEPYEGEPFPCTGSQHLQGVLIFCDSPAHR